MFVCTIVVNSFDDLVKRYENIFQRTRTFITRSLYIFDPLFVRAMQFILQLCSLWNETTNDFKSKICGLYLQEAKNQKRVLIAEVQYFHFNVSPKIQILKGL